jgi:hypothetical protein
VNFDGKVRAAQFTLITCDTGISISDLDNKCIHLQNLGGAEFNTDTAALAIFLDDLDFRFRAHERLSPLHVIAAYNSLTKRRNPNTSGDDTPVKIFHRIQAHRQAIQDCFIQIYQCKNLKRRAAERPPFLIS